MATATKQTKRYGNPGDVVTGSKCRDGKFYRWTATVALSGKLVGKTYTAV